MASLETKVVVAGLKGKVMARFSELEVELKQEGFTNVDAIYEIEKIGKDCIEATTALEKV